MRTAIVTNMPSYHQVDVFNALSQSGTVELHVLYTRTITPGRQWGELPHIRHPHSFVRSVGGDSAFYRNPTLLSDLRALQPEVVIVTQYASIAMQRAMYHLAASGTPWVFWSERPAIEASESPVLRSATVAAVARTVALVAPYRFAREIWAIGADAEAVFRRHHARVRQVPYFSDLEPFFAASQPRARGTVEVLHAGKFIERKGTDCVVAAAAEILSGRNDVRFTFVGDGPLRPSVDRLVAQHPESVRYLGFAERSEMPRIIGTADVVLCPSRYDGWGMIVPESVAAGAFVVSTPKTAAASALLPREADIGALVPPGSASAIKDAVIAFAEGGAGDDTDAQRRAMLSGLSASNGAASIEAALRSVTLRTGQPTAI